MKKTLTRTLIPALLAIALIAAACSSSDDSATITETVTPATTQPELPAPPVVTVQDAVETPGGDEPTAEEPAETVEEPAETETEETPEPPRIVELTPPTNTQPPTTTTIPPQPEITENFTDNANSVNLAVGDTELINTLANTEYHLHNGDESDEESRALLAREREIMRSAVQLVLDAGYSVEEACDDLVHLGEPYAYLDYRNGGRAVYTPIRQPNSIAADVAEIVWEFYRKRAEIFANPSVDQLLCLAQISTGSQLKWDWRSIAQSLQYGISIDGYKSPDSVYVAALSPGVSLALVCLPARHVGERSVEDYPLVAVVAVQHSGNRHRVMFESKSIEGGTNSFDYPVGEYPTCEEFYEERRATAFAGSRVAPGSDKGWHCVSELLPSTTWECIDE